MSHEISNGKLTGIITTRFDLIPFVQKDPRACHLGTLQLMPTCCRCRAGAIARTSDFKSYFFLLLCATLLAVHHVLVLCSHCDLSVLLATYPSVTAASLRRSWLLASPCEGDAHSPFFSFCCTTNRKGNGDRHASPQRAFDCCYILTVQGKQPGEALRAVSGCSTVVYCHMQQEYLQCEQVTNATCIKQVQVD
jgi:hypothetical protein